MSPYFQQYKRSDIDALIRIRKGETKLGELAAVTEDEDLPAFFEKTHAPFVVVGIAEDIGVVANYGKPGTSTTWNSFLNFFLNIQANEFTRPEQVAVIGHFSFDNIKHEIEKKPGDVEDKIGEYRKAVTVIDDAVAELIGLIVSHGRTPIVVGGGHNNSYPLLKGTAIALRSRKNFAGGINCLNLDAHIDYRLREGRHSGNGFRYAKVEGFLNKYFVLGIHENYLADAIVKEISNLQDIKLITYEDIFVRDRITWSQALEKAIEFTGEEVTGIELDMDSISNIPSSATTPCGVTAREAMQYVHYVANHCNVAYLHVCEGIASERNSVGKLISSLVIEFVKSHRARKDSGRMMGLA